MVTPMKANYKPLYGFRTFVGPENDSLFELEVGQDVIEFNRDHPYDPQRTLGLMPGTFSAEIVDPGLPPIMRVKSSVREILLASNLNYRLQTKFWREIVEVTNEVPGLKPGEFRFYIDAHYYFVFDSMDDVLTAKIILPGGRSPIGTTNLSLYYG